MSSEDQWRRAFAEQAEADFEAWEKLQVRGDISRCHQLLFLQMACEKLAKAHLYGTGSDSPSIDTSHERFAKSFPAIAKHHYARVGKKLGKYDRALKNMRSLAREIELLSPAVHKDRKRRDNCEYPWELQNGELRIPASHSFPNLTLLTQHTGRNLLKIVKEAISHLTRGG